MKIKKVLKILGLLVVGIVLAALCLLSYSYYLANRKFIPSKNKFEKRVAYIDVSKAMHTTNFTICDSTDIVDYYNYSRNDKVQQVTSYKTGKNNLRQDVLSKYNSKNYTDSGYLNFRFIVNCNGQAGAYVIHQNDLDLKPKQFNKDLIDQLLKITVDLKEWTPNYMRGGFKDSYMYISYRIEDGKITEILP